MKKIILSAALLSVITVFTSAQTTLKPSEKNSNIFRMAKSQNDQKTSSSQQLNNRKNYHFKNGQESTPTGREAGSVNGDEFISLNRDTNDQSKK